jgi:hypothetical protein
VIFAFNFYSSRNIGDQYPYGKGASTSISHFRCGKVLDYPTRLAFSIQLGLEALNFLDYHHLQSFKVLRCSPESSYYQHTRQPLIRSQTSNSSPNTRFRTMDDVVLHTLRHIPHTRRGLFWHHVTRR